LIRCNAVTPFPPRRSSALNFNCYSSCRTSQTDATPTKVAKTTEKIW
jgi:hypothetical protein